MTTNQVQPPSAEQGEQTHHTHWTARFFPLSANNRAITPAVANLLTAGIVLVLIAVAAAFFFGVSEDTQAEELPSALIEAHNANTDSVTGSLTTGS